MTPTYHEMRERLSEAESYSDFLEDEICECDERIKLLRRGLKVSMFIHFFTAIVLIVSIVKRRSNGM